VIGCATHKLFRKEIPWLVFLAAWLWAAFPAAGQIKRSRQDGLHTSIASITSGEGNVFLTLYGRTFLWDNQAAQKIPPALPHGELSYGLLDYLDLTAGINAMSYSLQPGSLYLRMKLTTPDTKSLRFLGAGVELEIKRNLSHSFPSNGYRVGNEGFGPEGYIYGGDGLAQSFKATLAADMEGIRLSSWLPFKGYFNIGYEGPLFSSAVDESNAKIAEENGVRTPTQDASAIPLALGLQFKTFHSDFFAEVAGTPFYLQVKHVLGSWVEGRSADYYARFHMVGKTFDVHLLETPWYVHTGSRLKYPNGLELQGGFSWLLSQDKGSRLGPCTRDNACLDGATDGFSPFFPQWKVFAQLRFPLRFTQPSSELYRSFLLRRYRNNRKHIDIDKTLKGKTEDAELSEEEGRLEKLMERRREADENAVDLE